jgi:hypothetical protein
MKKAELELYTDYWISTLGSAAATGSSSMVEGDVSHDRATRFLSERVLLDSGFASVENFEFIVKKNKHFIVALKDNRRVALYESIPWNYRINRSCVAG